MIGIVLLLLAIGLYFNTRKRYLSLFLYFSFMMGTGGGFGLWTDAVIGFKNTDCAIIYTFIINAYLVLTGKWRIPNFLFRKAYYIFLLFLGCSMIFSLVYYELSPFQVLQGGRRFLLIFSLPILLTAAKTDVVRVLKLLLWMCILTSILYILQILVMRHPIMPYGEWGLDSATGLPRMYNIPANLDLFLALSFLYPAFFPKILNINVIRFILFLALLCTLGRTGIVTGICLSLLSLVMSGNVGKTLKVVTIISLLLIPFVGMISQRFEEGNTENDLEMILNGDFGRDYTSQGDATMLYRFAWCYERADYLLDRPFVEQIFGMGLCSDSQSWVQKKYRFRIGLMDKETGFPVQLGTPDISYGNMITYLGFGGMAIYLIFCIQIMRYFWQQRKRNVMFLLLSAYSILMFISSFSGSMMSETKSFCLMFFIMSFSCQNRKDYINPLYRKSISPYSINAGYE